MSENDKLAPILPAKSKNLLKLGKSPRKAENKLFP